MPTSQRRETAPNWENVRIIRNPRERYYIATARRAEDDVVFASGWQPDEETARAELDTYWMAPLRPPGQDIVDYIKSEEYLAYIERDGSEPAPSRT